MYLFEKDFGKHFEYLGEFYDTDARITQNPAFQRSVVVTSKDVCIGEEMDETKSIFEKDIPVQIPSWYEGSTTLAGQEVFIADGQSVLVAGADAITFIGRVADPKEHFFMTTFSVDGQNRLHAKNMRFCHYENCKHPVSIVSHIYDEHGVELQRDCIQDVLPKEVGKAISTADRETYAATMVRFFTAYKFDCALGKLPVYKKTKKNTYCGYRRDLHNLEVVSQMTSEGVTIKVESSLCEGLTLMHPTEDVASVATKEEIAKAIAMEENEETRNALLGYSSWRGIQKDMVLNLK